MIRTNDGISLEDSHDIDRETLGPSMGESLEMVALELTLIRVAIERWYNAEYGE